MEMPLGDVLPELLLIGGAVAVLLYALFAPRRLQPLAGALAAGVLAVTAAATLPLLGGPESLTFADTYAVDGVALYGKLIVLCVTLITIMLSVEWFRDDPRHGEYYTILLFSALGAVLLAGATDVMELILGVLLTSATGYVLAAYHRRSKMSGEAAIKYYLLGALTNGALLYGAALLFGLSGSTTFRAIRAALAATDGGAGGPLEAASGIVASGAGNGLVLAVAFGLVLLGIAFKMGAVPAHAWMPDVAEGAPAPAAAFLTVAGKVGAFIVLARLLMVLPESGIAWRPVVAVMAAATMTLGNLAALRQDDVRRLLGWSSVSQTGYGLMALVALGRSSLAVPALLYFLAAYALANLAAFGVVIALRGLTDRAAYRGLARSRPLLALALALALLSFIGIPPLAGFTAKLALFGATLEAGYAWLAVLAVANTVLSVAYYARILAPVYFDEPAQPHHGLGAWASWGTGIAAAGVVGVGLAAEFFLDAFLSGSLLP